MTLRVRMTCVMWAQAGITTRFEKLHLGCGILQNLGLGELLEHLDFFGAFFILLVNNS